ncbi:sesquipedalian-1 isoform X1 [Drosophila sulfurigaster albostrigata]|uniref:sesquipedalian-1 isoform X1 n=1 Tax=Drosophila sulfurigaster albostrigata TaxID=89887 RepID=UPI002D218DC3|nr:sesquipedalian-1 isoform X1 [Drosophila sulfurigaster albostrigata]
MKINEKNLCVFARAPPYDMEGFLNKRGEINRAFQRRYFVLKGNLLFYFETRIDKEPLGLIIVEGCTIELSVETDMDNYCFEIAFNGNRTYVLAADTQESMEAWMKALTCAGYEYKRIIVAELQRQLQEIEESRHKMRSNPAGITLSAETDTTGKPKPPPRRQNPFNRPAPPPPTTDADLQCGVVSPMPFITGYFGSSQAKADLDQRRSNLILQSTPKGRRHGIGPSPTIFYNDNFTTSSQSGKLASITNVERMEQQIRLANAIEEFTRNHEQFRKNVMSDIIAYRERQSQPLIQF